MFFFMYALILVFACMAYCELRIEKGKLPDEMEYKYTWHKIVGADKYEKRIFG